LLNKSPGTLKGYFDIEIGRFEYIIEIKKASSLTSGQRDRAVGQISKYLKLSDYKTANFLLLIIGLPEERDSKWVNELERDLKDVPNAKLLFL